MDKYIKTEWVNDDIPALDADNLNHIERGVEAATDAVTELEETGINQQIDEFAETISIKGNRLIYIDSNSTEQIIGILPNGGGGSGADGNSVWKTTVEPTAPNYPAQPGYGFSASNLIGRNMDVQVGDVIFYNIYYYIVTQIIDSFAYAETRVSIRGAKGDKGDRGEQGIQGETGAHGPAGKDGTNGKDGTSVTHSWNGTTLTVTSAGGTSSADLKGDKGDTYTLTSTDKTEIAAEAAGMVNVPAKTSELINDSGFLTQHQSLSNYYNKSDINNFLSGKANASHTHSEYLTEHQDISGKESTSNKVTSISSEPTNTEYPSALAVKDYVDTVIGGIENGTY